MTEPEVALKFRSLKPEDWPEADRRLLEEARRPARFLKPGGPASGWRLKTLETVVYRYGVFLWWLSETGRLQPGSKPIDRVTPENIEAFVEAYGLGHASTSLFGVTHGVHEMTRVMHPEASLAWLCAIVASLKAVARPRSKLPRMADHGSLIALGESLIAHGASRVDEEHMLSALAVRDGCVILFEVACPLRRSNLEALYLGETLLRDEGGYRVSFEGAQMKNHQPYDAVLPDWMTPHLDFYLEKARRVLSSRSGQADLGAFWLGAEGKPISGKAISRHIRQLVKQHLGRAMHLHLFRDGAATTLAVHAGAQIGIAGDILGHTDETTSGRHYNQARGVEASRRYHRLLADLRDQRHDSAWTDRGSAR
jgi:integrase